MPKQTHPKQQPAQAPSQGLNTPPRRITSATVVTSKSGTFEIGAGITQFQILPNGLAIQIFREDAGDEHTFAFSNDIIVRVTEGVIDVPDSGLVSV